MPDAFCCRLSLFRVFAKIKKTVSTSPGLPYFGVTLDRTLSYKAHIEKTTKKVGTRNNIIRKLRNSQWGATPTTLRSSALALCYSAAKYACPVWERSTHAKKMDATLNETCRMITGCLKPTNTKSARRPYSPESPRQTPGERWQVVRNGRGKLRTKSVC